MKNTFYNPKVTACYQPKYIIPSHAICQAKSVPNELDYSVLMPLYGLIRIEKYGFVVPYTESTKQKGLYCSVITFCQIVYPTDDYLFSLNKVDLIY